MSTAKHIPIAAAERIAKEYGYDQVVILARKPGVGGCEHITTYGVTKVHCQVAAHMGDALKKLSLWAQVDTQADEIKRLKEELEAVKVERNAAHVKARQDMSAELKRYKDALNDERDRIAAALNLISELRCNYVTIDTDNGERIAQLLSGEETMALWKKVDAFVGTVKDTPVGRTLQHLDNLHMALWMSLDMAFDYTAPGRLRDYWTGMDDVLAGPREIALKMIRDNHPEELEPDGERHRLYWEQRNASRGVDDSPVENRTPPVPNNQWSEG